MTARTVAATALRAHVVPSTPLRTQPDHAWGVGGGQGWRRGDGGLTGMAPALPPVARIRLGSWSASQLVSDTACITPLLNRVQSEVLNVLDMAYKDLQKSDWMGRALPRTADKCSGPHKVETYLDVFRYTSV